MAKIVKYTFDINGKRSWSLEDDITLKTINGQRIDGEGDLTVSASVTKESIEAVLTGEISTHSHAGGGGLTQSQILARNLGC